MGFKIKQKGTGAEVKIIRHSEEKYVGQLGKIVRVSLSTQKAYVKLSTPIDGVEEIESSLNDLIIP